MVKVKVTQLYLTLCNPVDYTVYRILQARILEWVSCSFLQGIFPTQGSSPGLPHCRWIPYQLSHKGSLERQRVHIFTNEKQSWEYIHFHTEKLHVMGHFTTIKMKTYSYKQQEESHIQCGIKKARDM